MSLRYRGHGAAPKDDSPVEQSTQDDKQKPTQSTIKLDTSTKQEPFYSIFGHVWRLGKRLHQHSDTQTSYTYPVLLMLAVVVLLGVNTAMSVWFSYVLRDFTSKLQEKEEEQFYHVLNRFMMVIMLWVPADAAERYAEGKLSLYVCLSLASVLLNIFKILFRGSFLLHVGISGVISWGAYSKTF